MAQANNGSLQYEKFKNVLKKMFMLDQADLDFGLYRIMNQKKKRHKRVP